MDWLEVSVHYRHLFVNMVGSETLIPAPTLK